MKVDVKVYFNLMRIFMLIVGILLCITLIGIIFGVPMIIGSNAMGKAENYSQKQLKENNTTLLVWGVIFGACTLPAGAIAIVFAVLTYNTINEMKSAETIKDNTDDSKPSNNNIDKIKQELEDLERMHENGVITDEEYKTLRNKILS